MSTSLSRMGNRSADGLVLVFLYALELSIFLLVLSIHRLGERAILSSLDSTPGLIFVASLIISLLSSAGIVQQYRKCRRLGHNKFGFTIIVNLVTLLTILAIIELAIRGISVEDGEGSTFAKVRLLPRSWAAVVKRNRDILKRAAAKDSYLVPDDLLGWNVGANQRSANGLYFSGAERIRSPNAATSFRDHSATYRIALVGDSHTFSADVKYEDSWGYQLERALGSEFQVLNFGVSGYGVDQAFLRYYRDVRPWAPDFVIFGVAPHDLIRSMTVYPFISFPDWEYPFAKPRFIMRGGELVNLNRSPLPPEAIFSKTEITDLPFVDHDIGFRASDWKRRYYHISYLVRYLISKYPAWRHSSAHLSKDAIRIVNSEILRAFAELADSEGTIPILVYIPGRIDLRYPLKHSEKQISMPRKLMQGFRAVPLVDLTTCLARINPSQRYAEPGIHYSPYANKVIAERLREILDALLQEHVTSSAERISFTSGSQFGKT
jgi:hypothetical protein